MIPQLGLYDFSATESERILRLPLFYGLKENEIELVSKGIEQFFEVI
ncbi:MAG: hypothetical protein KF732_02790 [Flavobacteriales bacterium]|nr:hypothetical protein [Flavobacteriales bacterium]